MKNNTFLKLYKISSMSWFNSSPRQDLRAFFHRSVNSTDWANQILEGGYDNGYYGKCNFEIWWETVDEKTRADTIIKRNTNISKGHWITTDNSTEIKDNISKKQIECWENLSDDDKDIRIETWRSGLPDEISEETREKLSDSLKKFNAALSEDERVERGSRISNGRIMMSDESKQLRAKRYSASIKNSVAKEISNQKMKEDRIGSDNPNAKPISIDGIIYNSIVQACDHFMITRAILNGRLISTKPEWKEWKRLN